MNDNPNVAGTITDFPGNSKKSKVVNPYNSVVECRTCARLCPAEAISFPDEAAFSAFIKGKLSQ